MEESEKTAQEKEQPSTTRCLCILCSAYFSLSAHGQECSALISGVQSSESSADITMEIESFLLAFDTKGRSEDPLP